MRSVGLLPAIALVAGAAAGVQSSIPPRPAVFLAPLALAIAVLAWWRHAPRPAVAAVLAGCLLCALAIAADARDRALHSSLRAVLDSEYGGFSIESPGPGGVHDPIAVRMVLTEDAALGEQVVALRGRATAARIRGAWRRVEGGVALSVAGASAATRAREWRAGRVIEAPVTFRRPSRYLDDGVPDQERDLALNGVTLFASSKSALLVDVRERGSVVDEAAASVRAYVRAAVARWVAIRDPVAGAIVTAVLIGDRTGLPDEVRARLQAAGTYHVIAISGGNIAILAAFVIGLLVVVVSQGRTSTLLAMITLVAYALVVTAGASVWRATLMAVLYLAARLVDQRTPAWHAIALAAGVLAVWHPLDIRDAGFILTFGATAALLGGAHIGFHVAAPHRAIGWMAASVMASLSTELALMPVSAYTFSRVTCAGLVLNLVAVPAMAVVQVAGMAVAALAHVPVLAGPAGWIAWAGARAITESARVADIVPWLTRRVPPPSMALIALYYAALGCAVVASRRVRAVGVTIAAAAALGIVTGIDPLHAVAAHSAPLRFTVFDVGQGDAMVLQAGGNALEIDTGGSPFGGNFDIGGRVVAPALWARGVRHLDTLLITHGDPDHIGGAVSLVDAFAPRGLWLGVPVPGHGPTDALLGRAMQRHIPVEYEHAGGASSLGQVHLRVLNPPPPDWDRRRVRNDDSVVLEATYGDVALLLTGDIGADVERAIVPHLTSSRIRVLKVAHHGSRTSSSRDLLEAWRPQVAIVSVGRGNRFGHPAPDVIDRLEAIGARIYRTDRDGEVTLESDGVAVDVRTFIPAQK